MEQSSAAKSPKWMWPAFAIPAAGFLIALAVDNETVRIALKAIPVLVLALAVWSTAPRTQYRLLVSVGLLFGAGGDLLLEKDLFVFGLVSFLVGHLFYVPAFLGDTREPKLLLGIPYLAFGVGLTVFLAEGAGDLLIPVAVYAVVLSVMGWRAAARIGAVPRVTATATAIGAASFIVSDAIIAIDRFNSDIAGARWWIMTTYWLAQGLIAYGAIKHESRS
ncbi:MAG: lysoplasmalogenase [Actinomycetota bacterium]|nr:lysoplasmalogenase [Actinomycetota bacterium]